MELKDKLQLLRKQNGYSKKQLADKLGITWQTLSKWGNGQAIAEWSNLISLSNLYEITIDRIVKEDEECNIFLCRNASRGINKVIEFLTVAKKNTYVVANNKVDSCRMNSHEGGADIYLEDSKHRAISIGLPLEERTFNAQRTRIFFEGLLPEGFTRRCVAEWMHMDENDYISILAGLGRECLGAIKIVDESAEAIPMEYRELSAKEVYALASEGATESAELVTKSHLSLTGASGKVGLYFNESEEKWYLPIGEAPSTHIVKQSHVRLKKIVANEQLCLLTAKYLGIEKENFYPSS